MSTHLESQLADYGRYFRDSQNAIHLFEITGQDGVLLAPGIEHDVEHDPAIDVDIAITARMEEDALNMKPSTLLLLAAAAVIVVAGIYFALGSGSDGSSPVISDEVPAPTLPPTPEEIGTAFIRARDSWDSELAASLFAPDPIINDLEVTTPEGYDAQYIWYEAVGWNWEPRECVEETPGANPAVVRCAYGMETDWSRALGLGPFDGSFEFEIVDGEIAAISTSFPAGFSGQVWSVFRNWIRDNHPDDLNVMFDLTGAIDRPFYTPESIGLWEQRTAEFVAETTGS